MEVTADIYWQIILLSIAMVLFSRLLAKKFGLSREEQMRMQLEMQQLQEDLKAAQSDPQKFNELNAEVMGTMQTMMKKQMIPMIVRMVFFFGFWAILGAIYGKYGDFMPFRFIYSDWRGLYFTTSLGFSLLLSMIKKVFKVGGKSSKDEPIHDQIRALKSNIIVQDPNAPRNPYANLPPRFQAAAGMNQMGRPNNNLLNQTRNPNVNEPINKKKSTTKAWKQNLEKEEELRKSFEE